MLIQVATIISPNDFAQPKIKMFETYGFLNFVLVSLHSPLQQTLLRKHQKTRTQTHPKHTHTHKHTTHALKNSKTHSWLGFQANEQHANSLININ